VQIQHFDWLLDDTLNLSRIQVMVLNHHDLPLVLSNIGQGVLAQSLLYGCCRVTLCKHAAWPFGLGEWCSA